MKNINKDYISVVRNVGGRLQYEKIPVVKSVKATAQIYKMCEEDNYTIEDMEASLRELPAFRFLALPYYESVGFVDFEEPEDWKMSELIKGLKAARTKVKFCEKAIELIQECDYRWNVIRITNSLPDILIHSLSDFEDTYLDLKLTKDMSVVFECSDLECKFGGNLCYTVYKDNTPLYPYRSVVELYECSDDILDATKVFDPEVSQWDNALKSFVTTVNAILDDPEDFLKTHVVEAGQEMLEKIKLMALDPEAYYNWIEKNENVSVDYSECDKTLSSLKEKKDSNRRIFELYSMGNKMNQAILLAENLRAWAEEGLIYKGLDKVHEDLNCLARVLLQEMESVHDEIPEEVFSDEYGEYSSERHELHAVASLLRSVCERLRMFLSLEQRFPDTDNN